MSTVKNYLMYFRGIGTIDIELTDIDINQCDLSSDSKEDQEGSIDVFRGTHHCLPTTVVNIRF